MTSPRAKSILRQELSDTELAREGPKAPRTETASTMPSLITLDFVQTLAAAGLVLFGGYAIQRRVGVLSRYNIPAPVVGGLLVAVLLTALRAAGHEAVRFDTTLQPPLMIAFFTSLGFGASVPLLRAGGPAVAVFLALA